MSAMSQDQIIYDNITPLDKFYLHWEHNYKYLVGSHSFGLP